MSKALELVKDNVFTLLAAGNSNSSIVEAITELEELLKPKSCSNCDFLTYDSNLETSWFECRNDKSAMCYNTLYSEEIDTFGCNYHERRPNED